MRATTNVAAVLLMLVFSFVGKANTKITVSQVTSAVTLDGDVDYVITSKPPFAGDGVINITNTEHAVVILECIKPSSALSLLKNRIRINGMEAINDVNCQVKIYAAQGSMILPYSQSIKPLAVYSEQNFGGESVNDFGLENDGGYMNTLTDEKLNNRIRSFRLKRGYMVTFSTQAGGRGYSRCFIADDKDLEMAELPRILDRKITSYRVFKWNSTGKAGLANSTDENAAKMLKVTSCYTFSTGRDMGVDCECVPHHIYEDWPSSSACGKAAYSPHMKTNNEPGNSADDHPQTVDQILANWENLMRTGMRLCSPSSHDGSLNHLRAFMDSIDARGWRCDIIDLHCYWTEGSFNNIKSSWVDRYHRPIWISEWVWGASWNKNGAFASGVTEAQNAVAVKSICSKLNSWDYIERYFYWNSERDPSRIYKGGLLTAAGEDYAAMRTGVGYNGKYDFVPTIPRQRGFGDFRTAIANGKATLTWKDYNGEYNQLMEVLRKEQGGQWATLKVITPQEGPADYTYVDEEASDGVRYRLHIVDFNGRHYYSSEDMEPGDFVEMPGGTKMYAGGNVIPNGTFGMGVSGWTSGTGDPIGQPWFAVFPKNNSKFRFLQAFGNKGIDDAASVKTSFAVESGKDYVFRMASSNGGTFLKVSLTADGKTETENVATLEGTNQWATQVFTFNSGGYTQVLLAFRWLGAKAQLANIELRRLFETREEAIADGIACIRKQAEAVKAFNTSLPALNDELAERLAAINVTGDVALADAEGAVSALLEAVADRQAIDSLLIVAEVVDTMDFDGREALEAAVEAARRSATAGEITTARQRLQGELDAFLPMGMAEVQPQSPLFDATIGWEVKVGTHTGGDQRIATKDGITCWNAWWSGISAAQGIKQTMEIRQQIEGLSEGLYALECKATTQHYCLSDQRGYIATATDTAFTPRLQYDYYDIPGVGNIWQTLTSTPAYVPEGGTLTIGFVGSKQGATDYAWREYGNAGSTGDRREGWWCATDFRLLYHPLFKFKTIPGQWGAICLPYTFRMPPGMKFYRLAGLQSDYSRVCLEEVGEIEPGYPYIYKSEHAAVTYYTYGTAALRPVTQGTNNLRGYFRNIGLAPQGSYVLKDNGEWYRVAGERPKTGNYTAIISKAEGLPVFDVWDGPTMVIHGVADELGEPTGIVSPQQTTVPDAYYTIGGQRTARPRGLHIKVEDRQAVKTVKRE